MDRDCVSLSPSLAWSRCPLLVEPDMTAVRAPAIAHAKAPAFAGALMQKPTFGWISPVVRSDVPVQARLELIDVLVVFNAE
jgi:hypothetical protein